jgi:polar amino acid transport system substrate-binding protein
MEFDVTAYQSPDCPHQEIRMTKRIDRRSFLRIGSSSLLLLPAAMPSLSLASETALTEIRKAGVLRIGCEGSYPPLTFRDPAGNLIGHDIDLANAFCKDLGVKAEFVDTVWAGVIPSLYTHKFDLVMSSLSYTAERMKRVRFSIPYVEASQAMLIRAGDKNTLTSIKSMNGKTLGVKLGSPGQTLQPKLDADLKAAGGAGFSEVKSFDDHPAAYMALSQGKVDGVLNTLPTLAVVMKRAPNQFAIVKNVGTNNWAGIAARSEDAELIGFIDQELLKFKKDGTLRALQEKWFGFDMALPDTIPNLS